MCEFSLDDDNVLDSDYTRLMTPEIRAISDNESDENAIDEQLE
jgi:hypothetical protein